MVKNLNKIEFIIRNRKNYLFHTLLPFGRDDKRSSISLGQEDLIKKWKKSIKKGIELDLYVHVPFCYSLCNFCHTRKKRPEKNELNDYLLTIIDDFKIFGMACHGLEFRNLWIGGGTPNIFCDEDLLKLFKSLFSSFKFKNKNSFKTIELHPDLLTKKQLDLIKNYFSDISIGIQSFNPIILKSMCRKTDIKKTKELVQYAMSKGFNEVNCDLVAFSTKDNLPLFQKTILQLLALSPDMITIFPFQVPGSYKYILDSKISRFNYYKKTEKLFYTYIMSLEGYLEKRGYEISNKGHYTPSLYIVKKGQKYNMHKYQPFPYQKRSVLAIGHNSYGHILEEINYDTDYIYNKLLRTYQKEYRCTKIGKRHEVLRHVFASFDTFGKINSDLIREIFKIDLWKYFKKELSFLINNKIVETKNKEISIIEKSRMKVFKYLMVFLSKKETDELYLYERSQKDCRD